MEKNLAFAGAVEVHAQPEDNLFQVMISEYERVLVSSLITTFGLDFIIKDQHGGDVDTVHNVRQIDKDPLMTYKNAQNQAAYDNRGEYDSAAYHGAQGYKDKNAQVSAAKKDGTLQDVYSGKTLSPNEKVDLDHTVSAKEIHDDRGRVLAGVNGPALANSPENLNATHMSINRSKKQLSADEFIAKLKATQADRQAKIDKLQAMDTLNDAQRKELNKLQSLQKTDTQRLKEADEKARKELDRKVNTAYYTSAKFAKDLGTAAAKTGGKMAVRQALGFVFTEIWFAVKDELDLIDDSFNLSATFEAIGRGIHRGFEQSKVKYKELFDTTLSGGIAGALASVTTTLCNIFFTTAKNTVRLIRQSWVYLVDATKVLFLNPDDYLFGERIQAAAKIVAVGSSIVAGVLLQEALEKTGLGAIPIVGELVPTFCSVLVSGLLSCTFLIYLDRSKEIKALVATLNHVPTISTVTHYYRQEAQKFMAYAAQMQEMDIDAFTAEVALYETAVKAISTDTSSTELNAILHNLMETLNIKTPWVGDFNSFMGDGSNRLVFE
ncbi:hypothetical protein RFF05_11300 [Bengtsoniella intestinalis]|uniref:hypothetical protein n=1 Tax=Bengtsoniella intestinalis TaxID=3073143 RepID=UPI00391F54D7